MESDPRSDTPGGGKKNINNNGNNGNDGFAAISTVNNSDDSNFQYEYQYQQLKSNEDTANRKYHSNRDTITSRDGVYVCDSTDRVNTSLWVVRLSDLTAGYLPGDLSSVVRRAVGTFSSTCNYLKQLHQCLQ